MKDRIPYGATPQECAGWWLDLNSWEWPEELGKAESMESFGKQRISEGGLGVRFSERALLMVELAKRCTDEHLNEEADRRSPHVAERGGHCIKAHRR